MTRKTPNPTAQPAHELPAMPPQDETILPDDMVLNAKTFGRYMHWVELLGKRTGIKVHVSDPKDSLENGDIFLFNHFTRFETVVAPYILFRETGKMVRSVAYHGLFDVNDTLSKILHQSGGVPTNMARLLPFLAEEILRGRKVIIFPEGGLVKDKSVVDANGNLKMWSGVAEKVRKPHRGAAVLALMLDLTKRRIRSQFEHDDTLALANWCARLNMGLEDLKKAVEKPTLIVPSNITFYPMRTSSNVLVRTMERLVERPAAATKDELTIEGNLLLRPTDMDVRFGEPISPLEGIKRLQHPLLDYALANTRTTDDVFSLKDESTDGTISGYVSKYVAHFVAKQVDKVREEYARKIYLGTTININHLTAMLVRILSEQNRWEMPKQDFHNVLYVALKLLQNRLDVNLHPTLARPEHYHLMLTGKSRGFIGFLEACTRAKLITMSKDVYKFSRRLQDVQDLQDIRLENPLQVHANEASPIIAVREVLTEVLGRMETIDAQELALHRFDDMVREHAGQRYRFSRKAPTTVIGADNPHTGRPFLLMPEGNSHKIQKTGVVLVHGFATSPAELRTYAEHLRDRGHIVLGVRLPGHGTSPLDLEARTRRDWLGAVREAYGIVSDLTDDVALIGFSTGGALSLLLAGENLPKLVRVASVSAPVLVQDSNMQLLPLGMALRWIFRKLPVFADTLRFYDYDRDVTPTVYHKVPLLALNELRLLIGEVKAALPRVSVPVLVMQGLQDHTVKANSASYIFKSLGSQNKVIRWIAGGPHGLISRNFGATWSVLDDFVAGKDVTGTTCANSHKIVPDEPAKRRWSSMRITKKRPKAA